MEPASVELVAPNPLRQSAIARFDNCALSLLFDLTQPKELQQQASPLTARGTLFHLWVSKVILQMRAEGWDEYPVEMGLELLLQVLVQRDVPDDEVVRLPMSELRWLRVLVTRWCEWTKRAPFNAQRVVAVEERLAMNVPCPDGRGGTYTRTISGQPDVLVAAPGEVPSMVVVDWKGGWAPPANEVTKEEPQETDEQRLSEQGYAQQVVYGAMVLANYPSIEVVTLREAYVMYEEYREASIHRGQLERVLDVLGTVIAQIDAAIAAGPESARWVPTAGTHCGICPKVRACPLKDWKGIPETLEEAQLLAREWHVGGEVRKERLPLVKGWVNANGPIPIDHGKGRREVGWVKNKTGDGRSFKMYEPKDAPASPFDERMEAVLRDR
jgi:hypothetical protein